MPTASWYIYAFILILETVTICLKAIPTVIMAPSDDIMTDVPGTVYLIDSRDHTIPPSF